jgi:fructoselysine 6-kinase
MKIVCVGDSGIDHYLPSNDILVGGISANFARHAMREFPLDDEVHLISAVGSDDAAKIVLSALKSTKIKCHISLLKGQTPVQHIEVQVDGERRFVRYEEGVLRQFRFGPADRALIASSDLLIAPVYLQITDLFDKLMTIQTAGKVCVDFADFLQKPDFQLLERHLENIDIGFFGLSPSNEAIMAKLQRIARDHDKLFIVTLGAAGSIALRRGDAVRQPAIDVDRVIDTTGAGDAFAAGFLSHYCHGSSLDDSLAKGSRVAAGVVQHFGGITKY